MKTVLILGAGFAGLELATVLSDEVPDDAMIPGPKVTLALLRPGDWNGVPGRVHRLIHACHRSHRTEPR